jgi:hypothetical protein
LCREDRRGWFSHHHVCRRCRRRSGVDMSAAALPRRARAPFRGRSGSARRPQPLGRRRVHSQSQRRTRQTDGWSWAVEGGDELGRHVPQQLPRQRASWRRRRQRHGWPCHLVSLVIGSRLRVERARRLKVSGVVDLSPAMDEAPMRRWMSSAAGDATERSTIFYST